MNGSDKMLTHALIDAILANNCRVSVFDGEEYSIQDSANKSDIMPVLDITGEDWIEIYSEGVSADDDASGWFYLIYANGSDNEPMICLSDYSSNDLCNKIEKETEAGVREIWFGGMLANA